MKEKTSFSMKKHLKLTKNNTFNNFFVIEFFPTISNYQFFKNDWLFINHDLFFWEKYSLQLYHFQCSK